MLPPRVLASGPKLQVRNDGEALTHVTLPTFPFYYHQSALTISAMGVGWGKKRRASKWLGHLVSQWPLKNPVRGNKDSFASNGRKLRFADLRLRFSSTLKEYQHNLTPVVKVQRSVGCLPENAFSRKQLSATNFKSVTIMLCETKTDNP